MTVADILEQAKALSPQERKELTKSLIDMMDAGITSARRRLSELRGLGKEIWQVIDAEEYVDQLRDEWEDRRED
jgi:hypothetical protein